MGQRIVFIFSVLLMAFSGGAIARAQANPPCQPAPNTSPMIVCFGSTPCPPGYVDPVGTKLRSLAGLAGQNPMLPPDQQRWLCQEASPSEDSSSGTTSAPAPDSAAAAPAGPKVASTTVQVMNSSTAGQYLADPYGMTLYTRTADPSGASTCSNSCSLIWIAEQPGPSLSLPSGASGALGVINRDDGTQQVTYNGAPLYTYTGDLQPGDVNGTIAGAYQPATP